VTALALFRVEHRLFKLVVPGSNNSDSNNERCRILHLQEKTLIIQRNFEKYMTEIGNDGKWNKLPVDGH